MFRGGESTPVVAVVLVIAIDSNFFEPGEVLWPGTVGEPVDFVDVEVHDEDSAPAYEDRVSDCRSPVELSCDRVPFVTGDED